MNPEENTPEPTFGEVMAKLTASTEELRKTFEETGRVTTGMGFTTTAPSALTSMTMNDKVTDKAERIVDALGGAVRYSIDTREQYIAWGPVPSVRSKHRRAVSISFEAFLNVGFSYTDIADEFGFKYQDIVDFRSRAAHQRVSGNPWEYDDTRDTKRETLHKRNVRKAAGRIASAISGGMDDEEKFHDIFNHTMALASQSKGAEEVVMTLGSMAPNLNDEKAVEERAKAGVESIILDITAETLNGDDAVRERASKWLTEITSRITATLNSLDRDDNSNDDTEGGE